MSAPLETRNENLWKGLQQFKDGLEEEEEEDA
jgi:hypothetical protein